MKELMINMAAGPLSIVWKMVQRGVLPEHPLMLIS
jgi:hypothetical protein